MIQVKRLYCPIKIYFLSYFFTIKKQIQYYLNRYSIENIWKCLFIKLYRDIFN